MKRLALGLMLLFTACGTSTPPATTPDELPAEPLPIVSPTPPEEPIPPGEPTPPTEPAPPTQPTPPTEPSPPGAPPEEPTPPDEPNEVKLEVTEYTRSHSFNGNPVYIGMVKNNTEQVVRNVVVTTVLYDVADKTKEVARINADALLEYLPPGESSPFVFNEPWVASGDYRFEPAAELTTVKPMRHLAYKFDIIYDEEEGIWDMAGTLTNNTDKTLTTLNSAYWCRDEVGELIAAGSSHQIKNDGEEGYENITPGTTVFIYNRLFEGYPDDSATCSLIPEGTFK